MVWYAGSIAETLNTQSYGECLPGMTVYPICDSRNPNYDPFNPECENYEKCKDDQYQCGCRYAPSWCDDPCLLTPGACGCPFAPPNACGQDRENPGDEEGGDEGGDGGGEDDAPPPPDKVEKDTSVTNHPEVNCVVENLKKIIENIAGLNGRKVIIRVSSEIGSAEGRTYPPNSDKNQTNDFIININSNAYADDYSKILIAQILIHESFHVQLQQRMLNAYGDINIGNWTTVPTDSVLLELYNNYQHNKNNNIPNPLSHAEHDYMANHLDLLAGQLKNFIEANFLATAASIGQDLSAYKAFIYKRDADIGYGNGRFGTANLNGLGGNLNIDNLTMKFDYDNNKQEVLKSDNCSN